MTRHGRRHDSYYLNKIGRANARNRWQVEIVERFLVRVCRSRYASRFILKGGVLLSTYIPLNRRTQDLDFLVRRLENRSERLEEVIREIIEVPVDDGFMFRDLYVDLLPHPHMKYSGVRATLHSFYGSIRFKVSLDIGSGDLVTPVERSLPLTYGAEGPLFESSVDAVCYSVEFIFAEKLEAAVFRAGENTRMKDYHDLYLLVKSDILSLERVGEVIRAVFQHRQTLLVLPMRFGEAALDRLQRQWEYHLRGLVVGHPMPDQYRVVLETINDWLSGLDLGL